MWMMVQSPNGMLVKTQFTIIMDSFCAITFLLIPSPHYNPKKNVSSLSFSDFILKFNLQEIGLILPKTHSIQLIFI
jgi:hypothetical protein